MENGRILNRIYFKCYQNVYLGGRLTIPTKYLIKNYLADKEFSYFSFYKKKNKIKGENLKL